MSEETIFQEVDDELRRDRMHKAWRRYGVYLIGAAVLVVLLVAANEGWSWLQSGNAARSSDQFYAALDLENGGDLAGTQKALDKVIADGSGQYPVLAKFKQAGLLARQGKQSEALAAYDALATAQSNPRLRELALLLGANTLVDTGDVAGVKSRVEGLLVGGDPFRNSARETLGLAQYKAGDLNGARDSFEAVINDAASPEEARGRLQFYVAELVAQGATPPASAADAAAEGAAAVGAAAGVTPPSAPAANDNSSAAPAAGTAAPADSATGVESSQPSVPDAALDMATPAPATAPAPAAQPMLQTGAGLAAPAADAPAPAASAPAADAVPAPAASAPAANDAAAPTPATGTAGH